MFKYIGLAVLFLSAVYIGQITAGIYKSAIRQIESFILFIKYIKSQIEYYNTPYPEIYNKFTNDTLEKCGFINRIRAGDWRSAISGTSFNFDDNTKELLLNFGNEIGKSHKDDQINNCKYIIEQLEIHYITYKSELPKKIKLCTSLSMMAGLSIVIILS